MKVKEAIKMLSRYSPEDEICLLYWDKEQYDYAEDEDFIITTENWTKICHKFDEWDDAGSSVTRWISEAVHDHLEPKP
jgi:hypothetical protein